MDLQEEVTENWITEPEALSAATDECREDFAHFPRPPVRGDLQRILTSLHEANVMLARAKQRLDTMITHAGL